MLNPIHDPTFAIASDEHQPEVTDIKIFDGIFQKLMLFKKAGSILPQHSHSYDHLSTLVFGRMDVWCEDEYLGSFIGPYAIVIKAHKKHTFRTLINNTLIQCTHNVSRSDNGEIDIEDVHNPYGE